MTAEETQKLKAQILREVEQAFDSMIRGGLGEAFCTHQIGFKPIYGTGSRPIASEFLGEVFILTISARNVDASDKILLEKMADKYAPRP